MNEVPQQNMIETISAGDVAVKKELVKTLLQELEELDKNWKPCIEKQAGEELAKLIHKQKATISLLEMPLFLKEATALENLLKEEKQFPTKRLEDFFERFTDLKEYIKQNF